MYMKRFLLSAVALLAVLRLCADEPLYRVPVLGDFHYDRMELHDEAFLNEKYPRDRSQIINYTKASTEFAPLLVAAVAGQAKSGTPFVIQLGDFTEGLCGSRELQEKMFCDAIEQVKSKISVPFLVTKGNHDITGPGAKEAYRSTLLPFLAKELGRPVDEANYVVTHDRDAFVFFDSMEPDLDWLERQLGENRSARNLFVVTHYPVIPFEYRADWSLLAKPGQEAERARLIAMLEKANAIVLCGHLHRAAMIEYQGKNGTFYQLAVNSVMRSAKPVFRNVLEGAERYTPELADEKPASDSKQKFRKQLFAAAVPHVRRFFRADGEGYLLLKVYADHVDAEFYNGTGESPDKTIRVR